MENYFEARAAKHGNPAEDARYMNGCTPVWTYNISRPMKLQEFMELPEDLKKEYLSDLRRKHGGTTAAIADMLGCDTETVKGLFERAGVSTRGGNLTGNRTERWTRFVKNGGSAVKDGGPPHPSPAATPEPEDASCRSIAPATEMKSTTGPGLLCPQGEGFTEDEGRRGGKLDGFRVYEKKRFRRTENVKRIIESNTDFGNTQQPEEHTAVSAVLRAFSVDLSGPIDSVLERLLAFAALAGQTTVRITLSAEEAEGNE